MFMVGDDFRLGRYVHAGEQAPEFAGVLGGDEVGGAQQVSKAKRSVIAVADRSGSQSDHIPSVTRPVTPRHWGGVWLSH